MRQAPYCIMVVDDDADTCALLVDVLVEEGYEVHPYLTGERALEVLHQERFDLILTDIRMPHVSGIDLLLHVRRMELDTVVILMTAYASVQTAIQALRGEAFDYLTKPFSLSELRQRVRQALEARDPGRRGPAVITYNGLTVDQYARRVWLDEQEVKLTRLEFDVLAFLFERLGATVSREDLLEQVWGDNEPGPGDVSKVKSCIRRLRAKLGDDAHDPVYIVNVWGVGYQLGK